MSLPVSRLPAGMLTAAVLPATSAWRDAGTRDTGPAALTRTVSRSADVITCPAVTGWASARTGCRCPAWRLGAGRAARTGQDRHRHPPLLVSRACDSATRNCAAATVCSGASTPPAPPSPAQVMSQVIVTVTGYAPPGCPALDWS
jgi:hypothetical protein